MPGVEAPGSPVQWLIMICACAATGYFEESYFRLYLLTRFAGLGRGKSVFLGVLLFTLCHVYEGPWGALNAAAAGTVLSLIFTKSKSFHGIAWAHGAYNAAVYAMAAL
jgi:membrane protease YdiL (CAAX protease family)